jgi:hypothetical protein
MIPSLSFFFIPLDMDYLSLFSLSMGFFAPMPLSMVSYSPCPFSRILLEREREVTPHTKLYFYGMDR